MSYKIKMVYIYKVKVEGWAEKGKLGLTFCGKILSSTNWDPTVQKPDSKI